MDSDVSVQQPVLGEGMTPESSFDWPQESMRAGNWSQAAERWGVIRKAYPDHPAPWFQCINAHLEANELEAVDPLLAIAIERFPNHPSSTIQPALLAMKRENWESAKDLLDQARQIHSGNAQTWTSCATLALHDNNFDEASRCQWRAVECSPTQANLLMRYAELAMDAERFDEALRRWEILRERFPEFPQGYKRASEAARALGDHETARDLLLAHQYGNDFIESDESTDTHVRRQPQSPLARLLGLVWTKAVFNLRSEVRRNYLSFGWWILEPLMYMVVYMVVFDVLLNRGGENYSMLLMTGLIPWMWTMKAISTSSVSILGGQNLMLQTGVHPIFFPLVMLLQATIKQIPVFILLVGFVWFNGSTPGLHWLAVIPIFIVQALFTAGFSLAVAAVIPFLRDLTNLVPTGLTLLMFLSGIFYDYKFIDEKWHDLFLMNPVAYLLTCYRDVFLDHTTPDFYSLAWRGIVFAAVCGLMVMCYHKLRYVYPRKVME